MHEAEVVGPLDPLTPALAPGGLHLLGQQNAERRATIARCVELAGGHPCRPDEAP